MGSNNISENLITHMQLIIYIYTVSYTRVPSSERGTIDTMINRGKPKNQKTVRDTRNKNCTDFDRRLPSFRELSAFANALKKLKKLKYLREYEYQ